MIKRVSNFVNPALNKCSFSLGKDLISLPAGISYSRHTASDDRDFYIFSLQPSFCHGPNILNHRPDII